jgi:DNA adenine methylase
VKLSSVLRYPGGKYNVCPALYTHLPENISVLIDPTVGGGSFPLFCLSKRPELKAVFADINLELVSFWDTLSNDSEAFIQALLELRKNSDNDLIQLVKKLRNTKSSSSFEDAVSFYVINRTSFSGTGRMGGISKSAVSDRFTEKIIRNLYAFLPLLNRVTVDWASWEETIATHASVPGSFLFMDPPYPGMGKTLYEYADFDHVALSQYLRGYKSYFMLTYNDCEDIRKLYKWANISPLVISYGSTNVNSTKCKKGNELIITNYKV